MRNADESGWAPGAWPGDYVTSYKIDYRPSDSDDWLPLHQWAGRPADEDGDDVRVERIDSDKAGCRSEVTTTIESLALTKVAEIRISAKGGHWIGLYELEVLGQP